MNTRNLLKVGLVAVGLLTVPSIAAAQLNTATGTLTVTATVESSIGLTFENDLAGVALTGAGTNAATMALGIDFRVQHDLHAWRDAHACRPLTSPSARRSA